MNNIDILEEKEKKAIENLKGGYWYVGEEGLEESIKIVLNLVETLIAENKELKELKEELDSVKEIYYTQREVEDNYILKSKVEEIISEEKEGIKRDLENIKKIKDEGWKKAIEQNINIRNRKIECLQSLLGKE